tara:strand:+ start:1284 stop:3470 length:2187 start_codon:yes stop_codon:yes gene_type:complete
MVKSRLHKKIEYPESKRMDADDKQHKSVIYQCNILPDNILYKITLGKERDNFSHLGVYYYPIYLLSDKNKIRGKIGVYEIESIKRLTIIDDDGDVNIDLLGTPILFFHVTKDYLQTHGFHTKEPTIETLETDKVVPQQKTDENDENDENENENENDEDDEDNIFDLSVQQKKKHKTGDDSIKITADNVFTKNNLSLPNTSVYVEETKTIAKTIRSQYVKNASDTWIVQAMENPNYRIKKIAANGDCFFTSVMDSYKTIGFETTVPKLRAMISQEIQIAQVEQYRNIYMDLIKENNNLDIELNTKEVALTELRRSKSASSLSIENARKIVKLSKRNQEEKESIVEQQEINNLNMIDFSFMKTILYDTNDNSINDSKHILDKFKMYSQTSDYWADTWAISTVERLLNLKVIIMEDTTDKNAIMRCTQMNDDDSKYKDYDPKHYIILNYTMNGNHYELLTYQGKSIFTFEEIPYDLKELVVRRCLEKMAGPFALIPAFRQFRYDLGLLDADHEVDDLPFTEDDKRLYDELPVLQFYERSAAAKPGKGNGDEVKDKNLKEDPYFADLNRFLKGVNPKEKKEREEWRKMLDDSWTKYQFEVDNKKWASVEHYMKALPFKDRYPAIYHNFSLSDTTSDISTDLKKVEDSMKSTKTKEGVHYKAKKDVKGLDPDLEKEHRIDALRSKFTQNADLTTLLASTKMSKLQKYIPKVPSKIDVELMKIRQEILEGKTEK